MSINDHRPSLSQAKDMGVRMEETRQRHRLEEAKPMTTTPMMMIVNPEPNLRQLLLHTLRLLGEGDWGDVPEKIATQGTKSFVITIAMNLPALLNFRFDDGTHCQFNPPYPGDAIAVELTRMWGLGDAPLRGFSVYADEDGSVRWMGYGIVLIPDEKV
jgi:hypothetical protein